VLKKIAEIIKGTEFQGKTYVVGGYVRDFILDKRSKDIDLICDLEDGGIKLANFLSENLTSSTKAVVYPRFGTGQITVDGIEIECVAPRIEFYVPDSRKPKIEFGTLYQDVLRRDFTVNTLLMNLDNKEVLDLTGFGHNDINDGIIRTPIDPNKTFIDDPLRMLRAVRFATKYQWRIDEQAYQAIIDNSSRLEIISQERIRDELCQMLLISFSRQAMELLLDTGLLKQFIPALTKLKGQEQNIFHDMDVWNHTMKALEESPPEIHRRLGVLFHDIGKPDTVALREDGCGNSFHGHEKIGADLTRDILHRLKFSNSIITKVVTAVKQHMLQTDKIKNKTIRRWVRKINKSGGDVEICLDVMKADKSAHHPKHRRPEQIDYIRERIKELGDVPVIVETQKVVTGHDLISAGFSPGPIFKEILNFVQFYLDDGFDPDKEKIMKLIEEQFGEHE